MDPAAPDALSALPRELQELVRRELEPGERLVRLWQPRRARAVAASFGLWLFAVPWTAFSLFWTMAASGGLFGLVSRLRGQPLEPAPSDFVAGFSVVAFLFGLPFVAVGFGMLALPYAVWRKLGRTCYVLTPRRVVLFEAEGARGGVRVVAFGPERLDGMSRTERRDGSGDLWLVDGKKRDHEGDMVETRRGLQGIADVRGAETLIRRTLVG